MLISIANYNFRYCRNVIVTEKIASCCVLGFTLRSKRWKQYIPPGTSVNFCQLTWRNIRK
jgi:hypothetical protein